jgi:hypothetical protein
MPDDLRLGETALPHVVCSFRLGRLYVREGASGEQVASLLKLAKLDWPVPDFQYRLGQVHGLYAPGSETLDCDYAARAWCPSGRVGTGRRAVSVPLDQPVFVVGLPEVEQG